MSYPDPRDSGDDREWWLILLLSLGVSMAWTLVMECARGLL